MGNKSDDEKREQSQARTLTESFQAVHLSLVNKSDTQSGKQGKNLARILEIENQEIEVLTGRGGSEDGSVLSGGILSKYNKPPDHRELSKPEKKKEQAFWNLIHQQFLDNALKSIYEIEAYHREKMEEFARQIEQIRLLLEGLRDTELALNNELDYFTGFGRFDLDEQGRFKNEKVEAAVKEWEARTGMKVDRRAPASYLTLLEITQDIEIRAGNLEESREQYQRGYEHHKTKREEADQVRIMLDSGDPLRLELAMQEMDELQNDLRVEMELALATEVQRNGNEQIMPGQAEINERVQMQDGFAFNFPPVNAEFDKAATNEKPGSGFAKGEKPVTRKVATQVTLKH